MLAAGMILLHVLLAPPPAERVAQAVREAYEDERVQRSLPERQGEQRHEPYSSGGSTAVGAGAGLLSQVLLWTLVGVGAAAVVLVAARIVAQRAGSGRDAGKRGASGAATDPSASRALPTLEEADRLAAEGRFDEAVHLLLLRAVGLVDAGGRTVPDHWTSREAAVAPSLEGVRRSDLDVLVGAVETSRFGDVPLGPSDWAAARAAYGRFTAAGEGAGAPAVAGSLAS